MDNREHIYDTQINPLMTQIIKICHANNIPMFASFQYDDDGGFCTTALTKFAGTAQALKDCVKIVYNGYQAIAPMMAAFTITKKA